MVNRDRLELLRILGTDPPRQPMGHRIGGHRTGGLTLESKRIEDAQQIRDLRRYLREAVAMVDALLLEVTP